MLKRMFTAAALVACLIAPAAAQAQTGVEGRFSFTFKGGLETNWGGTFHDSGTGTILGLPAEVNSGNWNDMYDPGWRVSIGAGYGLTPRMEAIAAFAFGGLGASEQEVGTVAALPLVAKFDDYKDWTLEGGVRYYFAPETSFNPYVSGVIGIRNMSAIAGNFSVPDVNVTFDNVGFYAESTVFMWGIDVGAQWKISRSAAVGVETGFRWQAKPGEIEGFAGTGLENINDAGSRIAFPILGTLTFFFE